MIRLGNGSIPSQPVTLGRETYSGLMPTHGPVSDDETVNSTLMESLSFAEFRYLSAKKLGHSEGVAQVREEKTPPKEPLWNQAAACSMGEKGRPRLSATAL